MRSRAWVISLAACCHHPDPKIKSFDVTPQSYCPSLTKKIHITWDTEKGDPTLQIGDAPPKPVDAKGELYEDPRDMTVTLTVTSGDLAPHVPKVVKAVERHPLASSVIDGGCHDGWVTAKPADMGGGPNAYAAEAHP